MSIATQAEPISADTMPAVLVVDDSVATTKSLSTLLKHAGYGPVAFNRGLDALKYAATTTPAAAVVDIHLPDINGLILSQKLREAFGPATPIIVLSGDTSMETLNSLPHVGATYFFSKPVNSSMLLERLKEWVA